MKLLLNSGSLRPQDLAVANGQTGDLTGTGLDQLKHLGIPVFPQNSASQLADPAAEAASTATDWIGARGDRLPGERVFALDGQTAAIVAARLSSKSYGAGETQIALELRAAVAHKLPISGPLGENANPPCDAKLGGKDAAGPHGEGGASHPWQGRLPSSSPAEAAALPTGDPSHADPAGNPSTSAAFQRVLNGEAGGLHVRSPWHAVGESQMLNGDGEHKGSGLTGAPAPAAGGIFEPSTAASRTERTPGAWRAQIFDQIVQRAFLNLSNGQNEVKIELKPGFLGHIRMQIITENHQVAVRILTDLPQVKELIENNIQQLKTDLQHLGLKMDELQVSVGGGNDRQGARQFPGKAVKIQNRADPHPANDKGRRGGTDRAVSPPATRSAGRGINYFA
ncbi:MAG: flagellar hook-length control protein FliK [Desulfobacterales bacterium]|nr:MAG: flagellar hook-length control protein FliK [Desulfobacterales bacterium]